MKRLLLATVIILLLTLTQGVSAQLPMSGKENSEFVILDNAMQAVMSQNGLTSGVLAISKDGVVVYQRGFGTNVPENTPMRLASVEKPIAVAAIRKLIADNRFEWTDTVFGSGGLLPHVPWNGSWGDTRLDDITVWNLANHRGGWSRATAPITDPQFRTLEIAQEMGVPAPAGVDDIISYMLSQPLEFTPGTNGCSNDNGPTFCYSNFGYMVLGRIVEEFSGMSLIDYYRTEVLTPGMWVPTQEIFAGRSLAIHQDPREIHYHCSDCSCTNIFNPSGSNVSCPYGGFHVEAFKGHGNLVATAATLLTFMDNYRVGVQASGGAGAPIPPLPFSARSFSGGMDGTSTNIWQRGDGINIVVLFPSRRAGDIAGGTASFISGIIDTQNFAWPTFAVDGFWVDFDAPSSAIEVGGYDHPFRTMNQAVDVGAGSKLRLQPGSSNWTGTISHKVLMDAPNGTATIGN